MKKIPVRLLSYSIILATTQGLWAQSQPTIYSTPFASVPLHLDSKTVTQSKTSDRVVKPNVMFFVDDSGSMRQGIKDSNYFMGYYSGQDRCGHGKLNANARGAENIRDPSKLCFYGGPTLPGYYLIDPRPSNKPSTISSSNAGYGLIERTRPREMNLDTFPIYRPRTRNTIKMARAEYTDASGNRRIKDGPYSEVVCKGTGAYARKDYYYAINWLTGKKTCYNNDYIITIPITQTWDDYESANSYYTNMRSKALGTEKLNKVPNNKIRFVDMRSIRWTGRTYVDRSTNRAPTASNYNIGSTINQYDPHALALYCDDYYTNSSNTSTEYACFEAIPYSGQAYRTSHTEYEGGPYRAYSFIHFHSDEVDDVRILAVIKALHNLLDSKKDQAHWNIMTLHGSESRYETGYLGNSKADPQGKANLYKLLNFPKNAHILHPGSNKKFYTRGFMNEKQIRRYINAITPVGGTPTTDRYLHVAETMYNSMRYRCGKNFVILLSDGDANGRTFEEVYQTLDKPMRDILASVRGNINANSSSDGDGLSRITRLLYRTDLKTARDGKDRENGDWDELDENGQPMRQNIETFTIGFGDSLSNRGLNYLRNAATGGECKGDVLKGIDKKDKCFFNAKDINALSDAFDKIFESIEQQSAIQADEDKTFSISTPSATGATTTESAALLTLDVINWASELKFALFDPKSNKPERDSSGKIKLVSADYGSGSNVDRLVLLSANNKVEFMQDNRGQHSAFGLSETEYRWGMMPWLLRSKQLADPAINTSVKKEMQKAGQTLLVSNYRVRSQGALDTQRQMSDVIGAPTIAVGRDRNNRQKYVITAANDGMVYMFQSTGNNAAPYSLKLNYLPADMQRQSADLSLTVGKALQAVANENYGKSLDTPHIYLNNGGISWLKTPKTAGLPQQYSIFGALGQGGRGAYALNVAGQDRRSGNNIGLDADTVDYPRSVPLWETEKGSANSLGYTIGSMFVGQMGTKDSGGKPNTAEGVHLYAFLANGYSSQLSAIPYDAAPTLYVYDAFGQEFGTAVTASNASNGQRAGQLISKISVPLNQAGALSTPTLLDSDLDGLVDFAFAGDQFGNLWRFDLRGAPSTWTGSNKVIKIYEGKPEQPIIAAPTLFKMEEADKFIIIFGTGSDLFERDQKDLNQQMVMGIYHDVANPGQALHHNDASILDQDIIEEQGLDENKQSVTIRNLSEHPFANHRAWRIKLKMGAGERTQVTEDSATVRTTVTSFQGSEKVTTQPQLLLGSVYFSTRIYEFQNTHSEKKAGAHGNQAETCYKEESESKTVTSGDSWLMTVDVKNGSTPKKTEGYSYLKDYRKKDASNNAVPDSTVAGVKLNHLSSAVSLFNRSALGKDVLQTDAHGAISSGEVVNLEDAVDVLAELKRTCLEADANYEAMLSIADATGRDTIRNFNIDGNRCPSGEAFIRVNWREIPL